MRAHFVFPNNQAIERQIQTKTKTKYSKISSYHEIPKGGPNWQGIYKSRVGSPGYILSKEASIEFIPKKKGSLLGTSKAQITKWSQWAVIYFCYTIQNQAQKIYIIKT